MIENQENYSSNMPRPISSEDSMRKKRRSSFFTRLSAFNEDTSGISDSVSECGRTCDQENDIKLTEYIKKLKSEKEAWKKTYENLKKDNSELKQKCSQLVDHSRSWELLLPEDKAFLQERPDYVEVGRLVDRAVEAIVIRHRLTTTTTDKLLHLTQECQQTTSHRTATLIKQIMSQFDELNLHCRDEQKEAPLELNLSKT